jgi:chromosome segregation ATPase
MMAEKMKDIDKEMSAIPYELTKLRRQKYDLEEENRKSTNENFALRETINKNKARTIEQTEEINKLNKKISALTALAKDKENELSAATRRIAAEMEKPELLALEIGGREKKLLKAQAKLDQDRAALNSDKEVLEKDRSQVASRLATLKRQNEEADKLNISLKMKIAGYDEKLKALEVQKDQTAEQLIRAKELNAELQVKINKAKENQVLLEQRIKAADTRAKDLSDMKEEYEKRLIEADQARKEADIAKKAYEKAIGDLEGDRKALRIQELKFQKLVRDKGMEAELEALEKANQ